MTASQDLPVSPPHRSLPEFETTFAVPLSCEACIKSVSTSLHALPGISSVSASLADQLIHITGNAAPSAIVRAIEDTGRDAILRGSGKAESAAVCILETHSSRVPMGEVVRGLVRMVEVVPKGGGEGEALVLADMTLKGVSEGTYNVSVRETGDISQGPRSVGGVWDLMKGREEKAKGVFGTIQVGRNGLGSVFIDRPVRIWEMIGRSMVVSKQKAGEEDKEDPDTLVGVIARSAGVWDNDKTVCSCSGKTVWEERKEQRGKGML
ncbi:Putative heavy metal-associated domain, HMA, heavy metal-associated domain superfamily [Septoria linicola]|uniref:Superoxide dismutase 1 copper chaperone n=1 Tax=Septoria linicola TaxID=215465 RepID=A0A9Q9AYS9_9PEZI|nr:putative heavy metal-associated domain, HMA, heavy metal-associated domain superfamily [Septoria linicola]USW55000.1 Putative heavy metal-associated domain, HMA, heavy metal-associated domain superfamily [Septoria linicola]